MTDSFLPTLRDILSVPSHSKKSSGEGACVIILLQRDRRLAGTEGNGKQSSYWRTEKHGF